MKNMTITAIAEAVGGKVYNGEGLEDITANGVVIDSRQVEAGYIFIAVKGERVDGHSFIDSVFEKGALAVVSEHELPGETRPYILVSSSTEALKSMAAYYRRNLDIKIVGITGSVGKTSTKEFIASVLSEKYSVLKTEGNFNNEIGLPLTILRIRDDHQIAVIEMGISHFGDMEPLGIVAKPDICVITNIGCCHLENLIDRDGVFKEKTAMFDYSSEDGEYVLNLDDDKLATVEQVKGKKPVFISFDNRKAAVTVSSVKNSGIEGTECTICIGGENIDVNIPLPGRHMVLNALMACAVGGLCQVTPSQMRAGIEKIQPVGGRVNIIKSNGLTIIDDCYNANPVSMKASIDVLKYASGRKVAILGDMFELGKNEAELHGCIGEHIGKTDIEVLITIGYLSKNIDDYAKENGFKGQIIHFNELNDFQDKCKGYLQEGDTVLVKASHGMHLENIIKLLTENE